MGLLQIGNKWKSIDQSSWEENMYKPIEFTGLILLSIEVETFWRNFSFSSFNFSIVNCTNQRFWSFSLLFAFHLKTNPSILSQMVCLFKLMQSNKLDKCMILHTLFSDHILMLCRNSCWIEYLNQRS